MFYTATSVQRRTKPFSLPSSSVSKKRKLLPDAQALSSPLSSPQVSPSPTAKEAVVHATSAISLPSRKHQILGILEREEAKLRQTSTYPLTHNNGTRNIYTGGPINTFNRSWPDRFIPNFYNRPKQYGKRMRRIESMNRRMR